MGIYVFDWKFLRELLLEDADDDRIPATISATT
jgi:ADP-glucose pyrophosphorylase